MPDARFAPEGTWRSGFSFLRPYETLLVRASRCFRGSRARSATRASTTCPAFPRIGRTRTTAITRTRGSTPRCGCCRSAAGGPRWRSACRTSPAAPASSARRMPWLRSASASSTSRSATGGSASTACSAACAGRRGRSSAGAWSRSTTPTTTRTISGAELSGAAAYKKEAALGIEYRGNLWGAKGFASHGELGFNVYVQLPLESARVRAEDAGAGAVHQDQPAADRGAVGRRSGAPRAPRPRAGRAGLPQRAARLPARPARGGAHQHAHLVDAARHRPRRAHHAVVRAARGARDPRHLPAGLAARRHLHLHQHAAPAALLQRHGFARAARAVRGDRICRAPGA